MNVKIIFFWILTHFLDYTIKEKPLLDGDMEGGPDYIILKSLDTDSVRIIGSVLGQSIALDYFVSQVISCSVIVPHVIMFKLDSNFTSSLLLLSLRSMIWLKSLPV